MKSLRAVALAAALPLAAQVDVGSGATDAIKLRFRQAFVRNAFDTQCSLPPTGDVRKFGPTGLIQEFQDAAKTPNTRLALVKADTTDLVPDGTIDVFQVRAAMHAYYTASGVNTIGYPTMDTADCPVLATNACTWQTFDRSFALFVFTSPTANGSNFQTREPFYTKWVTVGGINAIGAAVESDAAVTVASGITSSRQNFTNGALYSVTSGQNTGRVLAVLQPIYAVYAANGAQAGPLGLPVGEEQILVGGRRRQNFEGGSIEYDAGGTPVIRPPAASVAIQPSSAVIRLNLGETRTLTAHVLAANGSELDARTVLWTTTDTRVARLEASGSTVVVRAVGGGSARVTAISEGRASVPVQVFVTAPCCEVGEGAPTAALRQAFADAVARNRLELSLPGPAPVRRIGPGYAQELVTRDGQRVLIAKSDRAGAAYPVAGATLARLNQLGGLTGEMGYPASDFAAAGRQLFDGGALAGNPAMRVKGAILSRWAAAGYEAGVFGLPRAESEPFLTFRATAGAAQTFTGGTVYAPSTGPLAGRAFLVAGLILVKHASLGGAAGRYGMPVGDQESNAGAHRQDFEGGVISYVNGDAEARASEIDRRPEVTATPSPVLAGGRVRLTVGGFEAGATLRVTVTGQPEFTVRTQTGSHVWEAFVPASSPSATVAIRATDGVGVAQGLYRVVAREDAVIALTRLQGDAQTGVPGGRLPLALRVALRDETGSPIAGEPVRFNASPGASIEAASPVTDERGEAQAWLRLPATEGIVVATATAAAQVVSFTARSAASAIENFPRYSSADALAAAAAAVVRHIQNLGQLPQPFGPADPVLLEQFLRGLCVAGVSGAPICDGYLTPPDGAAPLFNPWRLGAFAANGIDVSVEDPRPPAIRDWIAQGQPVILALDLAAGGAPAGSHFVVATGVSAEGAIEIVDPSSRFARTTLEQYLAGFPLAGREWKATLAAAMRLVARAPSVSGFLVVGGASEFEVHSAAGACGRTVAWPNALATGEIPTVAPGLARYRYCDGVETAYQLDTAGARNQSLTDLGNPGLVSPMPADAGPSFLLSRVTQWTVAPLTVGVTAVVNAASLTADLAPGSLAAAFGQGFGAGTTVEVGGQPAAGISSTGFRVNFAIPGDLTPGRHAVRIRTPAGDAELAVEIRDVAPALFLPEGGRAVVVNQNGSANSPANPAPRNTVIVVFATGLGSTVVQGALQAALVPVAGVLEGEDLETVFAGATAGFPGLYQVNLRLRAGLAPGIGLRLRLRQGGVESNWTPVSVQ